MSKKKNHNDKFDTIHIERQNEWQQFSVKRAESIGLEKACILANINNLRDTSFENICNHFPYILPEKLKLLLDELFKEGDLVLEDSNGQI